MLAYSHDSAGHFGRDKTLEMVKRNYWWPKMSEDVASYVSACDSCQKVKNLTTAPAGLLQPLAIPSKKWESMSMDLITGLPRTADGFDAIVVFVDRFTKFARFLPTKTTATASDIAHIFFDYIYRLFGLPSNIVSDRDRVTFGNVYLNCVE